ncbi:mechanosensitive channel of small conductance-like 6 [Prunus dulcis]|uniref:Mechanosensitive channel of small conductance-like 6 n=1 Tax=Prunus dulcis TaxID=3755 RepID=A0A4Y1RZT6_PRUDU|nr:mechanosensitive channel of small conductance-like 6 [Prunus dulcis]
MLDEINRLCQIPPAPSQGALLLYVLSMSRLGGAAAVAPLVADVSSEIL